MGKVPTMKLLFFITTVVMFLGFTAGSYGRALVYVSSTHDEPLAVGEQMPLNIQIVGGIGVAGYEMTVGFDPTALRYIEGMNAKYLPAGAFSVSPITSRNTVYIAATSPAGAATVSEGVLTTLMFEVISIKSSNIELMEVTLSNSAGRPLAVTTENGEIVTTELFTIWDVNEDGKVNILDLTLVASNLTATVPDAPRVDINEDRRVDILDLVMVAQHLDAAGRNKDKPKVRVSLVEFNLNEAYPGEFVRFVSAYPPSGSEIDTNAHITLTFDNALTDVKVSFGSGVAASSGKEVTQVLTPTTGATEYVAAVLSGKVATVYGRFTPGPLNLTVTWTDGIHTLNYTVAAPDTDPPTVTGGTVKDGDKDVDPKKINSDGKIEITFSEEVQKVRGYIVLQTEGGDDVGWLGRVEGNKGVLELVSGKEIGYGTTYVIICLVSDAAGNRAEIRTVFVTKRNNNERGNLVEKQPVVRASKVSFKDDIQPILAKRCAIPGCHVAGGAVGLNLSQYDTFKKGSAHGPAFAAGNGKDSLIIKRIDGGGMPPGGPPLDAAQVQLFIDWIDQGAKNN